MDKKIVEELFKDHFIDIFDQAGNGVTITDPNQKDNPIIYVNKAFCDIFKYPYEESLGKNCRFLQANDTGQKNIQLIREGIKNQEVVQTVLRNYTKTGELIYNEIKISPIFDNESGKIKFFLGVQKDISNRSILGKLFKENLEKKEIQKDFDTILQEFDIYERELLFQNDELIEKDKRLESLNREFTSLFQNAPVSYIVINRDLQVTRFNKLANKYFRFSNKQENSLLDITKEESLDKLKTWINDKLYEDKTLEINIICADKSTKRFKLRANTYTIDENLLTVSLTNITESYEITTKLKKRVKKEIDLKVTQEKYMLRQAKLASMGEMIDAIAHQWLNPLTLIKLFSQDNDRLASEKVLENFDHISLNNESILIQIDHLVNTLNEFRSFYRPDTNSQCVSANDLIESTLLLIKDDLIKHQINHTITIENDFQIKVVKNQFKHVLLNLFTNSRDAFEEKQLEEKKINILVTEDDKYHILEVRDNAGGIPQDVIGKIFEPNFTTKATGKGTGVGLYLCKQILDKFHIQIEVSNKDNGACFTIKYQKEI